MLDSVISQLSLRVYHLKIINEILHEDLITNSHMHKRFKKL